MRGSEMLRRLRSLLPVSPLPWSWHRRIRRAGPLVVGALLLAGGVGTVLIQRASDGEPVQAPKAKLSKQAGRALKGMSPREKADAVVVSGLGSPAAMEGELRRTQLGGVLIGPEDWASGGRGLIARLRRAGTGEDRAAPLIVGRQEGGIYRSYPDLPPGLRQLEIGDLGDPALAESSALAAGVAMKRAGFDLNLAPVADVSTLDSPIADRAYGDDTSVVEAMTAAAVRGCKRSGLACAASHFPGLGGASDDTAVEPATVGLDAASLGARDLPPFRAAFEAGVPATVLSLAFYAAYDPVTPGALSPRIATELLRSELGFEGVAITDDLSAGAIAAGVGEQDGAVQALAAGSDLVVVGDPAAAAGAREAILAAARGGGIPGERLDQAVGRVLELKRRLGLL